MKIIPQNSLEKKGIFYCIQTIIESTIDIISMLVKDMGIPVKDDKENILRIVKERKLKPKIGDELIRANGMRNIIVHRYNGIEEKLIFNSIDNIYELIYQWLDEIEMILDEFKSMD